MTTQLLALNWPKLAASEQPRFCQALPWHSPVELRRGLGVQLFPSGHLPGAAAILLTYAAPHRTYSLVYTGDFFLSNSRLVEGLPLGDLRGLKPDVLILEGSYGTARHPHRRQLENQLAERIHRAIADGYSVLLPTSTLGLGQELLMLLRSHHYFTGRDLDIWVDGGRCSRLRRLPGNFYPIFLQPFRILPNINPYFGTNECVPAYAAYLQNSAVLLGKAPCIIITDETADLSLYVTKQ